jgi:RHS repeat-associated protein
MAKTEQNSPPAGMGQATGLGEAFSINLSTGQGTYVYQIPLPEGVAGHTPKLVLEYAHGLGHGAWGLGWRLPLRSIAERLDFGPPGEGLVPRFLDGDTELVPVADGSFRAMRESAFARYSRVGDGWRIEERNGRVHELGQTATARIADPDHPDRIVEWLVERSLDVSGNTIEYDYRFDQGCAFPASIRYAASEVRFTYESRPDVRHDGRAGFSRRRALRCSRLQVLLDPGPGERVIRTYDFSYQTAPGSAVSLLAEIRLKANGAAPDGSEGVVRPTIRFGYSSFDPRAFHLRWVKGAAGDPPPLTDEDVALVTLDDAPLPGILTNRHGREYYWANHGEGEWAPAKPLRVAPLASSFRRESLAFVDMDGSGTADLMVAAPDALQGYYENGGSDGWTTFVAFPRGRHATPRWSDPNLRLADTDHDGLVDALASQGRAFVWWRNEGREGWSAPALVPKGSTLLDIELIHPDVQLADMTGDGAPDIVRVQSGRVMYWPNLGAGRFGEPVVMANSPRLRRDVTRDALLFVDLDGDGCADLVQVSASRLIFYQNQNGARFADPVVIESIPGPLPGTVRAVNLRGRAGAGLVWNTPVRQGERYVHFELAAAQPPYLLTRVENGAGLVSEIFYRSAVEDYERDRDQGERWTTNFPFPYLVVGRTVDTDTVSGRMAAMDFLYHEAHFERHTRQFQGFRRTERIERGDASRPDTRLVHHFLLGEERLPGHGPEHAVLNGMLARIETYQLDGSPVERLPYRVETSEYGLTVLDTTPDGRRRSFVFVTVHREEHTERGADSRVEEKRYTYDANGNVTLEVHRGTGMKDGVAQPSRTRSTEITYAASATHYLLDKPARIVVRDESGTLLSEKRIHYDGPDFVGLPLGEAERGLVTREAEWVLTQADFDAHYVGMSQSELGYVSDANADGAASVFALPKRHRYDDRGLLVATRDALGNETRYVYDASGLFRTTLSDPLGDTTFEYDRATGQIVQVTYADGAVTRFAYDAQGRVLKTALPDQDLATAAITYSYDETAIPNKRTAVFRQANEATSIRVTYFDGSGKEFQERVEVEPGKFLVSSLKLPNPWGDLREEFEPTFAASAAFAMPNTAGRASRRVFYDGCGRVVRSINFNGGVSTAEYQPFRVILCDANDNDDSLENRARGQFDTPREEAFDVCRYLVRVTDHLAANKAVVTSYEVGPLGELASVSDAQGVKFRYRYDRRGSRLSIVLRESGERKIWYDARKKAVRTLDPAGHDLRATWDAIGRQTELSSGGIMLEEYTYNTPAQNAFGRLAEVRYQGGRQVFTYDAAGRLLERDYFYEGEATARTLRYEYDALGRETAVIHTDGTRIERELTFNGWLKRVPAVIQSIQYDSRGFPAEIVYENGVRTTYAYTPGPGRISRQETTSPQNDVFESVEFGYDKMDLLLTRNDRAPGASGLREYAYDPLYQVTRVSSVENGNLVERDYDYAADYNLRRFDEARVNLHYDDRLRPDRLSGLTPDGGSLFTVHYDGNGNLLDLPGQQFAYNEKNELVRFATSGGLVAEYRYDHLGSRISKTVTDAHGNVERTLYVADQAEIRNGVVNYFVSVGPLRVAVLTGGNVRFLHDNGLSSTGFVTDAAGMRIGTIDYHPFGNAATANGDVDFRLFSLGPVDPESGLVYMRRRYYSPQLGRFLTPDLLAIYQPERFLHTPQGLHLYAFVANDPLNKTDPSGMSFWSFVGGVVGAIVGVAIAVGIVAVVIATGGIAGVLIGLGLAAAAALGVTGVSYLVASLVDPSSGFGQFMRGFMIGFNAGMNGVLAAAIFGPVVGVVLGVVNFLAVFEGISKSPVYQGILGWSSWLMPMSWAVSALGVGAFLINLVVAGITFQQWDAAKIDKLAIDWKTGTIIMVGGLIRNGTAFNLGHFVFIDPGYVVAGDPEKSYDALVAHETGHTLAVAAFGSAFHLYDFIGENIVGAGKRDYGEKIAESHANRPGDPTIPMWG